MKKFFQLVASILSAVFLFGFVGCSLPSSETSSSSGSQNLETMDFLDYTQENLAIWAHRPWVQNGGNLKQIDHGETMSMDLTANGETRTAYKKIVHDCKNIYTGNVSKEIYFCARTQYTKEELSALINQGYNTIVFYLYVEAEGMTTGMLDMMRATFDNINPTINSVSFLVNLGMWNKVEYPLQWFVENYEKLNGQRVFLYPYQEKLLPTVYTFYFGRMTIEKL